MGCLTGYDLCGHNLLGIFEKYTFTERTTNRSDWASVFRKDKVSSEKVSSATFNYFATLLELVIQVVVEVSSLFLNISSSLPNINLAFTYQDIEHRKEHVQVKPKGHLGPQITAGWGLNLRAHLWTYYAVAIFCT